MSSRRGSGLGEGLALAWDLGISSEFLGSPDSCLSAPGAQGIF